MEGILAAAKPIIDRLRSMQQRHQDVVRYLKTVRIIQRPGGRDVQRLIVAAVDHAQGLEMLNLHSEIDTLVTRLNRFCASLNRKFLPHACMEHTKQKRRRHPYRSSVDATLFSYISESINQA
jgi:hypothetical protein